MSESCFTAEIRNDLKYDSPVLQMTCFRAKLPTSTSFPVFSDMKFGSCPTNLDPISCTVILSFAFFKFFLLSVVFDPITRE